MILWHELLPNLAVVAIATSFWTLAHRHVHRLGVEYTVPALALVMAAGTLATMAVPFQFLPGVMLDARYTFLAISAYFGGPLGAILPLLTAVVRRLGLGGIGIYTAIPQILAASGGGLLLHRLFNRRRDHLRGIVLLSLLAAFTGVIGFYLRYPVTSWLAMTYQTTGPFALILMGATLLAGLAIVQELRRHEVTVENHMYRAVIEALPDCLNAKDREGRFLVANPATAEMMGSDVAGVIGRSDADFYPPETASAFRMPEVQVLISGRPMTIEQRFTRRDGTEAWLATLKAPVQDETGRTVGVVTHNREITDRKRLEQDLERTRSRLTDALESMADGLAMFDSNAVLVLHNRRYREMFPLTAEVRVPGSALDAILRASFLSGEEPQADGDLDAAIGSAMAKLLQPGDRLMQLGDGRWLEARTRRTGDGGSMVVYSDVTGHVDREQRLRDLNERLSALATTDSLTELPNRRAFDHSLSEALADARVSGGDLSILMIDVDRFKAYNDGYGHPAGDECLRHIAATIAAVFAPVQHSVTARYGGEELAVVLPRVSMEAAAAMAAMALSAVRALALDHVYSEKGIVTVSIGSATVSGGACTALELLREADAALYSAKAGGRDCLRSSLPDSPMSRAG